MLGREQGKIVEARNIPQQRRITRVSRNGKRHKLSREYKRQELTLE